MGTRSRIDLAAFLKGGNAFFGLMTERRGNLKCSHVGRVMTFTAGAWPGEFHRVCSSFPWPPLATSARNHDALEKGFLCPRKLHPSKKCPTKAPSRSCS